MADHWDYEAFWTEARDRIRTTITRQEYDTWFANMTYRGSQEGVIELGVPSTFYRDQVKQRFQPAIEHALFELSARRLKLTYAVHSVVQQPAVPLAAPPASATAAAALAEVIEPPRRHSQLNPDYTFERLVEGESNTFALNAAIAIAKNPAGPTTRVWYTAASVSARPISCRRSATRYTALCPTSRWCT